MDGLPPRLRLAALMVACTLALSACESPEDKAERYYQSGMQLLQAGDVDRALLEFRNVFEYNGFHKEARKVYADTVLARGDVGEAYGQYLRLIEQYPDTPDVRQTLAEIAISRGDWAEAERHGRAAIKLAPEVAGVQAIAAALDYRTAMLARDTGAAARAVEAARAVLAGTPGNKAARRIVIDSMMTAGDTAAALPEIEAALAEEPGNLDYNVMKFRLLAEQNDVEGTGAQLKRMVELFPENEEVRAGLIRWYIYKKDFDGAEAYLRQLAGPDDGPVEGHVAVVQLLQQARSPAAAIAELDRLIAANPGTVNAALYGALRASLVFEGGKQAEAIAEIEAILAGAEPSDEVRRIKIILAQMQLATGNVVGARARVEEVLAEDTSHVDALKMRARWLIDEDKPADAILDLRNALNQNPRDAAILTLMAEAHERDGSPDLAGERLALAVEVSNRGVAESLRYAAFLRRDDRVSGAEQVLQDSLQANPGNLQLLAELAQIWVAAKDWEKAEGAVAGMRALKTPDGTRAALSLQSAILQGRGQTEESLALLQSQLGTGSGDAAALSQIVQTLVTDGKPDEARTRLDAALAEKPADPDLLMLSAGLHMVAGDPAAAEAGYRAVIAQLPLAENPVRMLYSLLSSAGREAEATTLLDEGLARVPASTTLRWIKAGALEAAGDVEGAIAVYEALYAEDSSNVVVANNLASLITTHRSDPASLERAFTVARRLRGSDVPAFQDTYGWIEYRRGNLEEALTYLEPAAAGLPEDASAQYHLGMTYVGLNRPVEAREALTLALEIAGASPLPQFEEARATLAALPEAPPGGGPETPAEGTLLQELAPTATPATNP